MTPLEALQSHAVKINSSDTTRVFLRNVRVATLWVFAAAVFLIVMALATNALYLLIGGWAVAIGAITILGVLIGAFITAFEAA